MHLAPDKLAVGFTDFENCVARDFTCQGSDSQGDLLNTQKILYQIDENGDDANRKTEAKTYIIIH